MSESATADGANAVPQGTPAPAAQPAAQNITPASTAHGAPAPVALTSDQLRQRLAEERAKGTTEALKRFGAEKPEDLEAKLKRLADLESEKLTAEERTAKQLADLTKAAESGKLYESVATTAVAELFEALPDAAKAAITELAPKTPAELLAHVRAYRKLVAALPVTPPVAPAPPAAQSVPALPAPPTPPPPPAAPVTTTPAHGAPRAGGKTPFETYSDMKARNDPSAAMFYALNRRDIEASRPAQAS